MNHNMQICTVCGYDYACIVNNEDIVECEDAEFREFVQDIPVYKKTQNLEVMLRILIECQKEIDEEEEMKRQEEAYNDPMSVGERAYEASRDRDLED